MHPPTNRPLYQDDPPDTPLGVNFNTKMASSFLRYLLCGYAEIKSTKVREGQNLQFMKMVASFQEIDRFYACPYEDRKQRVYGRFLCPFTQNESILDDWSVIVQSARWLELCNVLYIIRDR